MAIFFFFINEFDVHHLELALFLDQGGLFLHEEVHLQRWQCRWWWRHRQTLGADWQLQGQRGDFLILNSFWHLFFTEGK